MSDIKWAKSYDLKVDARHFRILVSEHDGNWFHISAFGIRKVVQSKLQVSWAP